MSVVPDSAPIVLATINARHSHAALGLRYLKANAGVLGSRIAIVELVLGAGAETMARRLLSALAPQGRRIVGLGVYVWNVAATTALATRLRELAPDVTLVLGGPEVSHELDAQPIAALADYVIQGPADLAFGRLAAGILEGRRPLQRVIAGDQPADLGELVLPYALYGADDIANRHLYVEASRGCPFKCAFCLSALDRTAWPFPIDAVIAALDDLHRRGARRFRFVDRTFNLRLADSVRILEFFLDRIASRPDDPCFIHFELIPDRLPPALRDPIARFPPGTLQFEIGIQTFDPQVQQAIDRRQDDAVAEENLRWLRTRTNAHLHVDLIAGLPGETLAGFGAGYDRLRRLGPHEIQIGLLKRLRGAPIIRHERDGRLGFEAAAPYRVRWTDALSRSEVAELEHIARFHERIVNSGRLPALSAAILDGPHATMRPVSAFARLRAMSSALHARFGRSHAIGFEALVDAVRDFAVDAGILAPAQADALAIADYGGSGARGRLRSMARGLPGATPSPDPTGDPHGVAKGIRLAAGKTAVLARQSRHRRQPAVP
jgi:radical SAM superfamily enzyme YgiQ (UPF0313 family)